MSHDGPSPEVICNMAKNKWVWTVKWTCLPLFAVLGQRVGLQERSECISRFWGAHCLFILQYSLLLWENCTIIPNLLQWIFSGVYQPFGALGTVHYLSKEWGGRDVTWSSPATNIFPWANESISNWGKKRSGHLKYQTQSLCIKFGHNLTINYWHLSQSKKKTARKEWDNKAKSSLQIASLQRLRAVFKQDKGAWLHPSYYTKLTKLNFNTNTHTASMSIPLQ